MNYRAILFDMDGTLVPMDMKAFSEGYFKLLYKKLAPLGVKAEGFSKTIWTGVAAMVRNDGSVLNSEAFWNTFEKLTGNTDPAVRAACLDFYSHEFHEARSLARENPLAKRAVELARKKAPIVALATNPLFPMEGQVTRMSWVGLTPSDFDLVTSYDTDRYCKPNPNYYISVCERLKVRPEECLLIGNDENEDAYSASSLGMSCYITDDCRIPSKEHPWDGPSGSFADLIRFLEAL